MVKLTVGDSYGSSKTTLSLDLPSTSATEITVGTAYDMSTREINLIERNADILNANIRELCELAAALRESGQGVSTLAIANMAVKVADTASKIVTQRRWYSVSTSGLLEAARAVGDIASPLVSSALRLIELLQKAKC